MADSSPQLTPDVVQKLSELTTVRRISDLDTIPIYDNDTHIISDEFDNSYLLTSTYLNNRYYNYRVKLNEITEYLNELGHSNLTQFRNIFDYFIQTLAHNTSSNNSYVKFKYAYTERQPNPIDNYAYTFEYILSSIQPNDNEGFSYDGENESSYAFTNKLTPGLVTAEVLEQYVRDTLGRIIGVPNTSTSVSDAIDSIIEFIDWFKDYGKDEEGLRALINRIDSKDREIISSYTTADQAIISSHTLDINNIITSYEAADTEIKNILIEKEEVVTNALNDLNTRIISLDNAIDNIEIPVEGVASSDNELTIGGTVYTLILDNKKLKFVEYTPINLTNVTPTKNFEYNSGAHTFTVSAKTTKECTVTDKWENSSAGTTTYSANAEIEASVTSFGNTSYTLTVKETDSHAATKTATVNVNYNQYAYWSTVNDTITDNLTTLGLDNETNNKGEMSSNGYPSKIYFSQSNWGTGKYIYFLIKGTGSHTFIMGPGTTDGTMAGGIVSMGTKTRYGNVNYTLYRSDVVQTGNCNVKIS